MIMVCHVGTSLSVLCYLQYHPNPLSSSAAAGSDINNDHCNTPITELTEVKIF